MTNVTARHADLVAQLRRAVFESSGEVSPEVRTAAGTGSPVPEPWRTYVEKVRNESYRVADADIDALKAAGRSEEEIFEITVAAAQGAALQQLDAGLRALGEAMR